MPRKPGRRRADGERGSRLVFEIGTEELPPAAAWEALRQIRELAADGLRAARIPCGAITTYSTPRRIVLIVDGMAGTQDDLVREVRGPEPIGG